MAALRVRAISVLFQHVHVFQVTSEGGFAPADAGTAL
jgi:hypothetical protein